MQVTSRGTLRVLRWREWLERRDLRPLLDGLPPRRRVALEAAWMLHALVGVPLLAQALVGSLDVLLWWRLGNALVLAITAVVLIHPGRAWREWGGSRALVLASCAFGLAAIVVLVSTVERGPDGPRVGVAPVDVPATSDARIHVAEVTRVVPNTPAVGRLQVGDRILAVGGETLTSDAPSADLIARLNGPAIPGGPTVFSIERSGTRVEVSLDLPPPPVGSALAAAFRATAIRNAALLGLLALFLWRDGQGGRAVGLEREGFWDQTRFGLLALVLLVAGHVLVSMLVTSVALGFGTELVESEIAGRRTVTDALLTQRVGWTAGIVLIGSTTEEVVFRGFLLPRLRHVTRSWRLAVAISVVAFGVGHLYEGSLATVQVAGIGLILSLIFLWRRHLMPCVVAHVGFNTLALLLAYAFLKLGLFDRLSEVLGS